MKKENTIKGKLDFLNNEINNMTGIDVKDTLACCRKDKEISQLKLSLVNQLLGNSAGSDSPDGKNAEWLAKQFWTSSDGRNMIASADGNINPLLDPIARQDIEDDAALCELCAFYIDIAGLSHDLYYHYLFDANQLGDNLAQDPDDEWLYDFQITNERLIKWLTATPYKFVAAHAAHTLLKCNRALVQNVNDKVYDVLAKVEHDDYGDFKRGEMSPADYVKAVITMMNKWLEHDKTADKLNLSDEELALYDAIAPGFSTTSFDEDYVAAAKELAMYFDKKNKRPSNKEKFIEGFEVLIGAVLELHDIEIDDKSHGYLTAFCERN